MHRQWQFGSALLIAVAVFGESWVAAHGGVDASAFILDPGEPGVVADTSFTFRWADASDAGTATASTTHSFFYTTRIPPPWAVFADPVGLEGIPIVEDVPESDPANQFTWNTATVAAGAYWIWSQAKDPDVLIASQTIVFSPYPVVVAHPGDAVHPSVNLRTPDGPSAFAEADRYEVEYAVFDPDASARVTLERALEGEEGFMPVRMLDPAETRVTLDTSDWAQGDWVLRARLEDGRGLEFTAFARFPLLVARAAPRDAGTGFDAETVPDGGVSDLGTEPTPASDGCRCAGLGTDGLGLSAGFTLLWVLCLTQSSPGRRRRRYAPFDA